MDTHNVKHSLRTFLGLNREKNMNIKAWPKKRSSYEKKSVFLNATHNRIDASKHRSRSLSFSPYRRAISSASSRRR